MTKKLLILASMLLFIFGLVYNPVYSVTYREGAEKKDKKEESVILSTNDYRPNSRSAIANANELKIKGNKIIGILRIIGSIISVIALIIIGIKYVTGSVEEKAEYKKTMMPYLIGALLVFGITNLLGILNTIIGGFEF